MKWNPRIESINIRVMKWNPRIEYINIPRIYLVIHAWIRYALIHAWIRYPHSIYTN